MPRLQLLLPLLVPDGTQFSSARFLGIGDVAEPPYFTLGTHYVTEEGPLAEGHMLRARSWQSSRAVGKSTTISHTRVGRLWAIRQNDFASARVDAIATDEEVAAGRGALLETGDNQFLVWILNLLEPLAECNGDASGHCFLSKRFVQVAPLEHHIPGTVALLFHAAVQFANTLAIAIEEYDALGQETVGPKLVGDS
jgi:hypothetical protein